MINITKKNDFLLQVTSFLKLLTCIMLLLQIVIYPLEKCAAEALIGDTIECSEYNVRIPLSYLVPDLLLTDLPQHLTVDVAQFQFTPQVCV